MVASEYDSRILSITYTDIFNYDTSFDWIKTKRSATIDEYRYNFYAY